MSSEYGNVVDIASAYWTELAKADSSPLVGEPPETQGSCDLSSRPTDTCMSDLNWVSLGAIFTFRQLRKNSGRRAEAFMSVVGATVLYKEHVKQRGVAPSEDPMVLGLYPVDFLD